MIRFIWFGCLIIYLRFRAIEVLQLYLTWKWILPYRYNESYGTNNHIFVPIYKKRIKKLKIE